MPTPKSWRDPVRGRAIVDRYRETGNKSLVGREFGLSKERIRQIIARWKREQRFRLIRVRRKHQEWMAARLPEGVLDEP